MGATDGPETVDAHFAANMKRVREASGLSRAEFVRILRETENWETVHQTTVTRIEEGERAVRLGEAFAIARALGVDFEHLLMVPEVSDSVVQLDKEAARLDGVYQDLVSDATRWHAFANTVELLTNTVRRAGVSDDQHPLSAAIASMLRTPTEAVTEGQRIHRRGMESIEEELAARDAREGRIDGSAT